MERRRFLSRIFKTKPTSKRLTERNISAGDTVLAHLPGGARHRGHWTEVVVDLVRDDGAVVCRTGRHSLQRKVIGPEDIRKIPLNDLAAATVRAQHGSNFSKELATTSAHRESNTEGSDHHQDEPSFTDSDSDGDRSEGPHSRAADANTSGVAEEQPSGLTSTANETARNANERPSTPGTVTGNTEPREVTNDPHDTAMPLADTDGGKAIIADNDLDHVQDSTSGGSSADPAVDPDS